MKKLLRLHTSSRTHWVGDGFPVRSIFGYNDLGRELSPFLLLDYAPPHEFPPGTERRGVGAHPHRGFETVTVAYQGELEHRDSGGGGGTIGAGDVQWMTAGRGIIHEEFHSEAFTRQGGVLQMAQLWVNLRAKDKGAPAAYQTLRSGDIPSVPLGGDAGTARVIAGSFGGVTGPARTHSPIELVDVRIMAGRTVELALPAGHTTAVLVTGGRVRLGGDSVASEADLAIYSRHGETLQLTAVENARVLVMAGEPFTEAVVGHGPFVMNSRAEIEKAFDDYESGRMGALPG